jgi:hypothetical protein
MSMQTAFTTHAKGSHAAHRPPVKAGRPPSAPPLVFGVLYPEQDVVAVIDDVDQARRAEAALHAAGISEDDSDVLEPQWVIAAHRDIDQRRGWLGRIAAGVSALASDESQYMQMYLDEAQRGRALVVVHAPTPEVVEQVRQVLIAYGAHGMRHYGRLTVTELPGAYVSSRKAAALAR